MALKHKRLVRLTNAHRAELKKELITGGRPCPCPNPDSRPTPRATG